MSNPALLGRAGEEIACDYLERHGHLILFRNYTWRKSEIDVISTCHGKLVFTEVKTRSYADFGYPETFVSEMQKERIRRGAEHFIQTMNRVPMIRFDIIAILYEPVRQSLYHFADAF